MTRGWTSILRSSRRLLFRVPWLGAQIVRGIVTPRGAGSRAGRAAWLHRICRRARAVFGMEIAVAGSVPVRGLLVANHLGYLDILLLSSLTPCIFVAKSEVNRWPVFGWFARAAGTIFIDRGRRTDVLKVAEMIRAALRDGALVVLFPEGTSSPGASVLPFKTSLFEALVDQEAPVAAAALRYELTDGDPADEVCYWGDHTLVPHLLNLLGRKAIFAEVIFSEMANKRRDRRQLAMQTHAEVARLHTQIYRAPARAIHPMSGHAHGSGPAQLAPSLHA